ncbi:hypothetical protein AURDEDRAFT_150101 [Auricularia subglabra TFB-10046 SS5]|nr:hypothetical protein AURDEDRAFT_150101 [Auricularia subglabra TFB-10046 SS5]
MSVFRRPTPKLECFCLEGRVDQDGISWGTAPPFPRYLPECPQLRNFRADFTNVVYTIPRQPNVCLRMLELCVGKIPCRVIWDLLRAAPALEVLDLQFHENPEDLEDPPDAPVHLPSLRELTFYNDVGLMFATAALNGLTMPALRELTADRGIRALQPFFQASAQGIELLHLSGAEVEMDDVAVIRLLKQVEVLKLESCTVQDDVLQALAVPDEWIFPRLQRVILFDVDIDPPDGCGLAHMVRARNLAAESGAISAPTKIRSVVLDDSPEIPAWLAAEVRYLLAEDAVVPVEPDPPIVDTAADEPDESEAEFSDSASSDSDSESESSFEPTEDASDDGTDETVSDQGSEDEEHFFKDRLRNEERSLAELQEHAERIEGEHAAAGAAYAAASRILLALQAEKDSVSEHLELSRRSVMDMRARLADNRPAKRPMQTMPTELLRAIFLELHRSYEPDELWDRRARFNPERARVPFLLSAVNRQFRELARDCPELWTYVGVPFLHVQRRRNKKGHANLRRVKQILALSKNMPIDVLVPWSLEVPWSSDNEWHRRILDMLSLFAHRFRRAEIRFPQKGDLELPLAMFSRSMPMLEELTVAASSNDVSWNPEHKYLQFCPRLRVLSSEYSNVAFSSPCAVTSLTLRVAMPCDQIWDLLSLAAPTVERLDIGIQWLDPNIVVDPPKRMLAFRVLKSLVVAHHFARMIGPWPGLVAMPALTDIEFDIGNVGMLHRFVEQCAPTLRTLALTGRASAHATDEHAAQLLGLADLETASLSCVVQDSFVQALVDGMWPKLKHFALVEASALLPRESYVLPRLVRARNGALDVEGDRAARLEKVTMDPGTVEDWVRGEVVYLLGGEPELSDGEPWGGPDDEWGGADDESSQASEEESQGDDEDDI